VGGGGTRHRVALWLACGAANWVAVPSRSRTEICSSGRGWGVARPARSTSEGALVDPRLKTIESMAWLARQCYGIITTACGEKRTCALSTAGELPWSQALQEDPDAPTVADATATVAREAGTTRVPRALPPSGLCRGATAVAAPGVEWRPSGGSPHRGVGRLCHSWWPFPLLVAVPASALRGRRCRSMFDARRVRASTPPPVAAAAAGCLAGRPAVEDGRPVLHGAGGARLVVAL